MSNAERNCRWHFAKSQGGLEQGPNNATAESFKKVPYEALVRESIQNSLDEYIDDNTPIVVTFSFKKTDSHNYPELFKIKEHIEACLATYDDDNCHKKYDPMLSYIEEAEQGKMDYLEISDENTKGMFYEKGNRKCNFHSFVKSVGNSSKQSSSAGGSYGFGKAAYFQISKINAVLVSTLTDKGAYHFEGVSSLCSHEIDGQNYEPVGFYCDQDDESPVCDPDNIPARFKRKEQGTSVFIMGLGLNQDGTVRAIRDICSAVIKHFWLSILKGKLIVRVTYEKLSSEINSNNIEDLSSTFYPSFDDNRRGHKNPRPYIDAVANAGKDDNHKVFTRDDIPCLGKVSYYLMKSNNGNDYILNMRSPMMLVNHELNGTNYGFYSVFVCENNDELLRLAENAAHSEWDSNNAPVQDKERVKEALRRKYDFIQECIKEVFASSKEEVLTFGGLDDFLSIPSSLDDEEEYSPAFGKPSGELTDEETSSMTTDIGTVDIRKPKIPTLGEVKVKRKKRTPKVLDEDGESQQTGHTPEQKDDTFPIDDDDFGPKDDEPKEDKPKSIDTNDGPEENMSEDEESRVKVNHLKPLRAFYV